MSTETPQSRHDVDGGDEAQMLDEEEGVYERDANGNLQPLPPKTIEYEDKKRQVVFLPVPMGDAEQFQQLGDDIDMEDLGGILADKVHRPDRTPQQWQDTKPTQLTAVIEQLVELATGEEPSTDLHAEIQDELDGRADEGN